MASDPNDPQDPQDPADIPAGGDGGDRTFDLSIEDELKQSYLTYAMSVIVSRALPDVRDGLKPSQRRILVAMNDLNLGPASKTSKCAGIVGETMKCYHPHGDSSIYDALVRMAQDWNSRYVLVHRQGNFGSVAGLPPAAMRYTEARLSAIAALMLEDLKLDTVDFIPTYDEQRTEPSVLPSKFPNLLVNGSSGIAVGMATSIPPHNLTEVCSALIRVLDEPGVSIDELMEIIPGPDFPTGGIICGRGGIRQGYRTGRGTVVVRARATIEEVKNRSRIIVSEIPYQQLRDRVVERIAGLANEGKIKGISGIRDESDLKEPVRLVIDLRRDADPDVVLNQLYQFSPLQGTFSIILLALVDGRPRELSIKEMLEEFLRHRVTVIRRRTLFLRERARKEKHRLEGLLLALADIDEIIRIIRHSSTQAEAKVGIMAVHAPAAMLARALGERGFDLFQEERGVAEEYSLTAVQADAILRMTLGQLVNLEQERLGEAHAKLIDEISEYNRILSDEQNIRDIVRDDLVEIQKKHGDKRRTEISGEELGYIDLEDLITEENMVVTISHNGYVKRTAVTEYRVQGRGGKGLKGARAEEEDPIEHLFVASTHDYLLFFTNHGKVYWCKVYDLPLLARDGRGRAIVNLLNLAEGEKVASCMAVRDFSDPACFMLFATRRGQVKKTPLKNYGRPMKRGIIAINLRDDDELVAVTVVRTGDEVILASSNGQAVRFRESVVRSMGRGASGVRGIRLREGDSLVGMVVADAEATLLTVCENGYGKRTPFGPNLPPDPESEQAGLEVDTENGDENGETLASEQNGESEAGDEADSNNRYPTRGRGGLGVRNIKATKRNGPVIGIVSVHDDDQVIMITAGGKLQRIRVSDISVIGRNTQGVRIMSLYERDTLAAVVRVPREEAEELEVGAEPSTPVPHTEAEPASTAGDAKPAAGAADSAPNDPSAQDAED